MNVNFIFVHTINLSDKPVKISSKVRLDFLINFDKTEAYLAKFKAVKLTCVNQDNLSCKLVNSTCFKTVLLNSIIVYSNEEVVKALSEIIHYHDIWTDHEEFAEVSEKE